MEHPEVTGFHHADTGTWSYVVREPCGPAAVLIDPVLDYDAAAGHTGTGSAQRLLEHVRAHGLAVRWILETHAHADHLSAAGWLADQLGAPVGIGTGIRQVQATFRGIFNLGPDFPVDGRQFDRLFEAGETFAVDGLAVEVIPTPGHTDDSVSYRIGDAVFVGDSLFMPEGGSARCDFPGGSAAVLYASARRLLALPDDTRVFVCHEYPEAGQTPRGETTVAAQRAANIHLHEGVSEAQFVALREARDRTLAMPRLIIPAIQWNIRGGRAPAPEGNGVAYLKIPLDRL
jgi:glyoxylase-like metal-dependent hydrolase (beta-lactamase superfamily II)